MVVVVSAYILLQKGNTDQIDYGDVSVDQAQTLIEGNAELIIVDVRSESEYADGHIAGAISIPVESLNERLSEIDAGSDILVYCWSGNRP